MGDFQPPAGPPPPKVPAGWKAVWNDQYKEWFFVNTFTKASQWDKPTEPVYGPGDDVAPQGPPPAYHGDTSQRPPEKGGFANNNPYGGAESDEALARRLQEEENRRVQGHGASAANRGEADSFYAAGPAQQYGASSSSGAYPGPAQAPPPDTGSGSKGLLSKLTGKLGGSSRPPQGYGQPPPHQYGGYPPQGYPPQQYGGYPPQPQYVKKQRFGGGGMGALGGAGLGLGAGMLGGAMLGSAMDGHDGGYHGGDDGGYGGDDGGYGGGDGGGFGGDDGGGDFGGDGGGDFGGD